MKKIFIALVCFVVLGSCTKQEPIEVTCNCNSSSGLSIDTALVGYWVEQDPGLSLVPTALFIGQDFTGNFWSQNGASSGSYSCDGDSHLSFSADGAFWTAEYTISGIEMNLTRLNGNSIDLSTTLIKQQ